jgi:hypothetical protein
VEVEREVPPSKAQFEERPMSSDDEEELPDYRLNKENRPPPPLVVGSKAKALAKPAAGAGIIGKRTSSFLLVPCARKLTSRLQFLLSLCWDKALVSLRRLGSTPRATQTTVPITA